MGMTALGLACNDQFPRWAKGRLLRFLARDGRHRDRPAGLQGDSVVNRWHYIRDLAHPAGIPKACFYAHWPKFLRFPFQPTVSTRLIGRRLSVTIATGSPARRGHSPAAKPLLETRDSRDRSSGAWAEPTAATMLTLFVASSPYELPTPKSCACSHNGTGAAQIFSALVLALT